MSPKQLATLDFVRSQIGALGLAPTIREIAEEVGGGINGAHEAVEALIDQGKLRRSAAKIRNLELADAPDIRLVDSQALRAELARRGETLERMQERGAIPPRWAPYCAADGCDVQITTRGHLMCARHWFSLSRDLQDGLKQANARRDKERFGELLMQARDSLGRDRA